MYQLNGDATDVSGNYNGTATNVTYGTGVFGQAGVFNGSSSYIDIPAFNQGSQVSVSFWLNKSSGGEAIQVIADKRTTGGVNNFYIYHYLGKVGFQVRNSSGTSWILDVSSTIGVWDFYTMTFGSGTLRIYKNGQFISQDTTAVMDSTNSGMRIGRVPNNTVYNLLGSLDQFRIFNTALDPLEVEALYTEELCICDGTVDTLQVLGDTSCIATYQLDGNANDLSGNYSGTPTDVSYGVGEFDLAGVFNGSSSGVQINSLVASLGASPNVSVSCWVKPSNLTGAKSVFEFGNWDDGVFRLFVIDNILSAQISNSSSDDTTISSTNTISSNSWSHIVLTFNGTSGSLYVNNNLEDTQNCVLGISTAIGSIGKTNDPYYFDGSIDQVRIFNKALDEDDVDILFAESACTYGGRQSEGTQILGGTSCIAYYKLDGTSDDETGTYNGTFTTPNYANGEFLYSGVFNGSTSRINIPAITPSDLRSVSFWINSSDTGASKQIFSMGLVGVYNWLSIRLNSGKLEAGYGSNNGAYLSGSSVKTSLSYNDSVWHHVVCTFTGTYGTSQVPNIYVNGTDVSTVAGAEGGSPLSPSGAGAFGYYNPQNILYFNGQLDQIRIFNKVVSPSEVTTLYNEGI